MENVLNWAWQGALLALVATGYSRMARRLRASARYRFWWITLLGVLALPGASSLLQDAPAVGAVTAGGESGAVFEVPVLLKGAAPALAALWLCGSAVAAIRLAAALILLRRIKAACMRFPADREARLPEWQRVASDGRRARLAISPAVGSAAVLGGRVPLIAVSPALLDSLADRELDQVVLHEWAHVQRRDDVVGLVQQILSVACGLHPAVWWCNRQLRIERELACDERVVETTGSAKAFAACLLKLAAQRVRSDPAAAPAVMVRAHMTTRIVRLLESRRRCGPVGSALGVVAGAVLVLATLGFATRVPLVGVPAPHVDSTATEPRAHAAVDAAADPVREPALARSETRRSTPSRRLPSRQRPPGVGAALTQSAGNAPVVIPANEAADSVVDAAVSPAGRYNHGALEPSWLPGRTVRMTAPTPPSDERSATPWSAAADAGVAIGRGSTKAARATAGFFTRLGKSIAGGG